MSNSNSTADEDYTLSHVHGTLMVAAWMVFASTGILFARYGRSLNVARRVQLFGEHIWFQTHRFALCLAAVLTLTAFFVILGQAEGGWVDKSNGHLFAHSILGMIVVGCAQIQVWMALFRCHPTGQYRYIFNWMHRLTGLCTFTLSIPTIFLITFVLQQHRTGLVTILSLWSAWVVIIVIVFEIIEFLSRKTAIYNQQKHETRDVGPNQDNDFNSTDYVEKQDFNTLKTILFVIHLIVALGLAIPLIVLIWQQ